MCGGTSNYRAPSLFVGWLHVVLSIVAVIYYTYLLAIFDLRPEENEGSEESNESVESAENDFQLTYESGLKKKYTFVAYIAGTVLLCFIPSILLVKGIKQNRRKLVAPWLYISYVSVAINCIFVGFLIWILAAFSGSLAIGFISCLPMSLALIIWCLCIYPVRKLYKIMSIPPPILPTQYVMISKKPDDHQHYMPIFEN